MAQGNLERNTFVRGLITEASALTFPENASIEEENFVLNREGSRQRRLGMDYENLHTVIDTNKTSLTFDDHYVGVSEWNNVNNDSTLSFGVVQIGNNLWFVDLFSTSPSSSLIVGGDPLVLDNTTLGYNISGNTRIDFTNINGVFVGASEELQKPIYITYVQADDEFVVSDITLRVRDIWGVFDSLDVNERPTTLDDKHKYNLLNQGWPDDKITNSYGTSGFATITLKDKYPEYYFSDGTTRYAPGGGSVFNRTFRTANEIYNKHGTDGNVTIGGGSGSNKYPSNADLVQLGKKSDGTFDNTLITAAFLGTTPAPKGKFIIDAFDRGASRQFASGLTGLLADQEQGRPSAVATYANRVFYSGIDSLVSDATEISIDYTGVVFFSQVVETNKNLERCYQVADPTSEEVSDLVPTDGGVVKITGASLVKRLVPTERSLIVFAENGVWEITGPDGVFQADDFSINEISNIGVISADSVVNAEGNIFYWSRGGIYQLVADDVTGRLRSQNLTQSTIQTFYNDIPSVGKATAKGSYDPTSRKVSWLYNDSDDYDGISQKNKYIKELVLDVVLQAFYVLSISSLANNTPYIAGFMLTENFLTENLVQAVVVSGEQVQVNGEDVVVTSKVRSRGDSQTKYLTIVPNAVGNNFGFTFSQYGNPSFKDWETADGIGVDSPAFLITGYELFGDSQRNKQVNYLTMHFRRTETGFESDGDNGLKPKNESSCLIRARWDFADNAISGKFGSQFQGYKLNRFFLPQNAGDLFEYGQEVVSTKTKLRGSGKALTMRIDSEPEKDMYILGWALNVEGRGNV